MSPSSLTTRLWERLAEVRSLSRLILVALEEDDVVEVERLARRSDRAMAEIGPRLEARRLDGGGSEDDAMLGEILADLKRMNDRILEELALRAAETRESLGELRHARLRLVHHRHGATQEPALLDRLE